VSGLPQASHHRQCILAFCLARFAHARKR
jgi:hypothetical protein